ncbi:MAG: tRNA (guanine-N7)-methyltransferase [Deinococcaceae bacterium]
MIVRLSDFSFPDSVGRLYSDPSGPWHLEIGFGDGRFWDQQAACEPGVNYLGVELSGVSLLKAQTKAKGAGRGDLLTRMPALFLLRSVIPRGGLDRIYVNFPDPWPKAEHAEHRLLQASFFNLAADRLRMSGEIWLTTDHLEYFEYAVEQARQTGFYDVLETNPPPAALETKYAQKWKTYGLPVYHARFRLIETGLHHPHTPVESISEDTPMPHALVKLPSLDVSGFTKQVFRHGETTVVLLEILMSSDGTIPYVLAHVEEPDLVQEVMVSLTPREDGLVLVRLERFAAPIITSGIKRAVGDVAHYLESLGGQVQLRAY